MDHNWFPIVYLAVESGNICIAKTPDDIPEATAIIVLEVNTSCHSIEDSLRLAQRTYKLGKESK